MKRYIWRDLIDASIAASSGVAIVTSVPHSPQMPRRDLPNPLRTVTRWSISMVVIVFFHFILSLVAIARTNVDRPFVYCPLPPAVLEYWCFLTACPRPRFASDTTLSAVGMS
jgi:hypothetical protein